MTTTKPTPPYTVLAVCATIVALAVVAALVTLVLYAPPETDLVKILGAIAGGMGLLATQVLNYLKTTRVAEVAESTDTKVTELTNGLMDAKIRAAVSEVVQPHLINPDAEGLIEADKARRENGHHV